MAPINLEGLGQGVEAALPAAAQAMQQAEQWLSCRDQHNDLIATTEEVLHALRGELWRERLEESAYIRSTAQRAIIKASVNAAMSLFTGRFQVSGNETDEAPPFGRVLAAVGPEGVPAGLQVFNVSALARSEAASELMVEKGIADKGYLLFTQEAFGQLVAWLRIEISAGRIMLPYHPREAKNLEQDRVKGKTKDE